MTLAKELHESLIIVDGLAFNAWEKRHFENLRAGGVTCINATVAIWEDARETLTNISQWYQWLREFSDYVVLARNSQDILKAKEHGKTAVLLGFQNTDPMEDDLNLIEIYRELGVRIVQLTYNTQNSIASGCWEENDSGLSTHVGKNFVRELNEFGMLIDLSHCSEKTVRDAAEVSTRPVAITHGNPHSFVGDNVELARRNRSDDTLRLIAEQGGIVGLSMYPKIAPDGNDCTLEKYCEMAAYTVDLIGIDAVSVATDHCDGHSREKFLWFRQGLWSRESAIPLTTAVFPDWMKDSSNFPNITEGLMKQGFNDEDVRKIMGGNFMRVLEGTIDAGTL